MSSAEGTNLGAEPPAALNTKWFVQNNLIYEKPLFLRFLRFTSFYKVMEEEDRKYRSNMVKKVLNIDCFLNVVSEIRKEVQIVVLPFPCFPLYIHFAW